MFSRDKAVQKDPAFDTDDLLARFQQLIALLKTPTTTIKIALYKINRLSSLATKHHATLHISQEDFTFINRVQERNSRLGADLELLKKRIKVDHSLDRRSPASAIDDEFRDAESEGQMTPPLPFALAATDTTGKLLRGFGAGSATEPELK